MGEPGRLPLNHPDAGTALPTRREILDTAVIQAGAVAPALSAPLRALATLVGYSRVHTGVHYPADVLVGAFIGVSAAELAGRLLRR